MSDTKPFQRYSDTSNQNLPTVLGSGEPKTSKLTDQEIDDLIKNDNSVKFTMHSNSQNVSELTNAIKNLNECLNKFVIENEGKEIKLEGSVPKLKHSVTNFSSMTLDAKKAVIESSLGMGPFIEFPLYHSGFWLRLNSPANINLIELYRQLETDKISILKYPLCTVFNNIAKRETIIILNFIKEHVRASSLDVSNLKDDLFNYVSVFDIPVLINYMAALIWRDGFKYVSICDNIINDDSGSKECGEAVQGLLNFEEIHHTDFSRLSKEQLLHMSKKQNKSVSLDEVNKYKEELLKDIKKQYVLSSNNNLEISITLKNCNINNYIFYCDRENARLIEYNQRLLSESPNKRSHFLRAYIKGGKSSEYLQNIEKFTFTTLQKDVNSELESENEVKPSAIDYIVPDFNKKETIGNSSSDEVIDMYLQVINNNEELLETMENSVREFISNSIFSVISRPKYECPSCGYINGTRKENSDYIGPVALDPAEIFFDNLGKRIGIDL